MGITPFEAFQGIRMALDDFAIAMNWVPAAVEAPLRRKPGPKPKSAAPPPAYDDDEPRIVTSVAEILRPDEPALPLESAPAKSAPRRPGRKPRASQNGESA